VTSGRKARAGSKEARKKSNGQWGRGGKKAGRGDQRPPIQGSGGGNRGGEKKEGRPRSKSEEGGCPSAGGVSGRGERGGGGNQLLPSYVEEEPQANVKSDKKEKIRKN